MYPNQNRGYAFVNFLDQQSFNAALALDLMDPVLGGRRIGIKESKAKPRPTIIKSESNVINPIPPRENLNQITQSVDIAKILKRHTAHIPTKIAHLKEKLDKEPIRNQDSGKYQSSSSSNVLMDINESRTRENKKDRGRDTFNERGRGRDWNNQRESRRYEDERREEVSGIDTYEIRRRDKSWDRNLDRYERRERQGGNDKYRDKRRDRELERDNYANKRRDKSWDRNLDRRQDRDFKRDKYRDKRRDRSWARSPERDERRERDRNVNRDIDMEKSNKSKYNSDDRDTERRAENHKHRQKYQEKQRYVRDRDKDAPHDINLKREERSQSKSGSSNQITDRYTGN